MEKNTPKKRIDAALDLLVSYGTIDGDHHKGWLLDQVAKALCRDENEYLKFKSNFDQPPDPEFYPDGVNAWDLLIERSSPP